MTSEELAAIREREQKATPGPWHAWYRESAGYAIGTTKRYERRMDSDIADISFYQCRPGHNGGPFYTDEDRERDRVDAEFIAHAREDIPVLLSEVDRLRTELQKSQAREGWLKETVRLFAKWMEDRPTLSSDLDRQIKFDIYDKMRQVLAGEGEG